MYMKKPFKSDRFGGDRGKKSFGGGSGGGWKGGFGGDRGGDRPMMHRATCAECGNACEVPFKPNGRKPIFCSNCFVKDDTAPKRFGKDFSDRPSFGEKRSFGGGSTGPNYDEQFRTLNAKLDAIIEALNEKE